MQHIPLSNDLVIADVLAYCPETISVFIARRMGCVGCPMAPFETLSEAARIYGFCCQTFIQDLQQCVNKNTK